METYSYPLKMEINQKERLQKIANNERRSFNQTILLIIDKFLKETKNARTDWTAFSIWQDKNRLWRSPHDLGRFKKSERGGNYRIDKGQ